MAQRSFIKRYMGKNKNIRYILELPTDAKEVKLTPKVNTWENETNNNINKDDVKDVTK